MESQSKGLSARHLVYLILAAVFAILSIRISKHIVYNHMITYFITRIDLRSVFWLTSILALCMLVPLIRLIFDGMHDRHWLPKPLDYFYQEEFRENFSKFSLFLQLRMRTLGGKLVLIGLAIFFIVAFVSNVSIIRSFEVNTFLSETTHGLFAKQRESYQEPIVRELSLYTASNDMSGYLQNCLKIVGDLQNVGAKAVLIDIPFELTTRAGAEFEQVEKLANTGLVVFRAPDSYVLKRANLSRGISTIEPEAVPYIAMLYRIRPAGFATWYPGGTLDMTLELLRKFHGYPATLIPKQEGSILCFGNYRIPVTKDGWTYSRDPSNYRSWTPVFITRGFESDTLKYRHGYPQYLNLNTIPELFRGKIIILRWDNKGTQSSFRDHAYASVLQNIIDNNTIRKVDVSPLWLAFLCIMIAGFIAYKSRPLASVLLIFLFGVLLLLVNSLLYSRMNLFIEMMYPVLSVLMSMVIFPAVAFIHGLGEEK